MLSREPGSLTVTIVKKPAATTIRRLPTDPLPADPNLIVKTGCHVEVQSQIESTGLVNTNLVNVWVFLPADADTMAIEATDVLRFNNRDYQMQGPAAVEYGLDGEPIIVWCVARWEAV